jgi:hypothetical protein
MFPPSGWNIFLPGREGLGGLMIPSPSQKQVQFVLRSNFIASSNCCLHLRAVISTFTTPLFSITHHIEHPHC